MREMAGVDDCVGVISLLSRESQGQGLLEISRRERLGLLGCLNDCDEEREDGREIAWGGENEREVGFFGMLCLAEEMREKGREIVEGCAWVKKQERDWLLLVCTVREKR